MFAKLRSRTEWQAYLLTVATLFANHFFGLGLSEALLTELVAASGLYGVSRGLAKMRGATHGT